VGGSGPCGKEEREFKKGVGLLPCVRRRNAESRGTKPLGWKGLPLRKGIFAGGESIAFLSGYNRKKRGQIRKKARRDALLSREGASLQKRRREGKKKGRPVLTKRQKRNRLINALNKGKEAAPNRN